jgi:chromosome partitioning protein
MTIIGFISQKGGVGKSTLSRALAREAAANGLSVKIGDLDTQQKTSVDWSARRMNAKLLPEVPAEIFSTAEKAIKAAHQYDLFILDGPARASEGTLEIARVADLVVQPTGASLDDLIPAVLVFHELVSKGISRDKLVFALSKIGTDTEEADARDYIKRAGYAALDGCVFEKPGYRKAQNAGKSITETNFKALNARADALIQTLIDKIGEGDGGSVEAQAAQQFG